MPSAVEKLELPGIGIESRNHHWKCHVVPAVRANVEAPEGIVVKSTLVSATPPGLLVVA